MGLEINEKKVGLNEELKKISGLTTVERLKASTQIAHDSATLNVFTLFVMRIEKHGSNFFLMEEFNSYIDVIVY